MEPVPEYVRGVKVRGVAIYRWTKLAGCGRDVLDARKIADALEIDEPLIVPVHKATEHYAGG